MASHSSILAFKIPWTEEPGGLHARVCRVGHDLATGHTHIHYLLRWVVCDTNEYRAWHLIMSQ